MVAHTTSAGKLASLIQEIDSGVIGPGATDLSHLAVELNEVFAMMSGERAKYERVIDSLRKAAPSHPSPLPVASGYVALRDVLDKAYAQAASGKGKDRHTKGEDHAFIDQPICELQRLFSCDYAFGQAAKKMEESKRLPKDKALAELLGAIVYTAAAYIVRGEQDE